MKKTVFFGIAVFAAAILVAFTACGGDSGGPILESLTIIKPVKTVYVTGETLDLSGLEVSAKYNDGSSEVIENSACTISGFDNVNPSLQKIVISYGGKSAGFTITMTPAGYSGGFPDMIAITGGSFTMGSILTASSSEGDPDREKPEHSVTVNGFSMGKFMVTQELYKGVMNKNRSQYNDNLQKPVHNVSWYEAVEFCNILSILKGLTPAYDIDITVKDPNNTCTDQGDPKWTVIMTAGANGYRLPTEAEWEYACRAGTTTKFNTGETITSSQAKYGSTTGGPDPVGSYPANPWGLFDMHGNLLEWCWDWYDPDYYSVSISSNPLGPVNGQPNYGRRVTRGGTWNKVEDRLRSAFRERSGQWRSNYNDLGFRLVFVPSP